MKKTAEAEKKQAKKENKVCKKSKSKSQAMDIRKFLISNS